MGVGGKMLTESWEATTMREVAWDLAGWPNETEADWSALAADVKTALAAVDTWEAGMTEAEFEKVFGPPVEKVAAPEVPEWAYDWARPMSPEEQYQEAMDHEFGARYDDNHERYYEESKPDYDYEEDDPSYDVPMPEAYGPVYDAWSAGRGDDDILF